MEANRLAVAAPIPELAPVIIEAVEIVAYVPRLNSMDPPLC